MSRSKNPIKLTHAERGRRGAAGLHAKPDVECTSCGRSFKQAGIGMHRSKCDPTWTAGDQALRLRPNARTRNAEAAADVNQPPEGG